MFAEKRIGPDGYRRVVNWATSQPDIDGTRIFAWCRCLDDLHALPVTAPDPQLRGAIVHPPFSNNRGAVRALRGALRRRAATSYPVLVVIDGKTSDSGLLRRMAQHSHGIEVFVAKPNAPERDCEHLDDRLLGVEVDFLRFHAGLPATMRQAR